MSEVTYYEHDDLVASNSSEGGQRGCNHERNTVRKEGAGDPV